MTSIPTPGAYTVTAPSRGALVHFHQVGDYVNATDTPEYGIHSTSCGRKVPATWTVQAVAQDAAVQLVTCPQCLTWARYHHVAILVATVPMPDVRREMFATDAANSAQRHAELVEQLAPAPTAERKLAAVQPWARPAVAALLASEAAPPVHGPGRPEQFGALAPCADTLLDRGRRAILRAEHLQKAARDAAAQLRLMPPGGTLHA